MWWCVGDEILFKAVADEDLAGPVLRNPLYGESDPVVHVERLPVGLEDRLGAAF
jgi:hypothetical protein